MKALELTGLDGQNPLAYFAALGLLRVLDDHACRRGTERPRLAFRDQGKPVPILEAALDLEAAVDLVLEDAAAQAANPVLNLAYDDHGELVSPDARGATRDLKPSPRSARTFLERCALADRRSADLAAAMFSELVQDRTKGNTKPTAFHFTAGQQAFLAMVDEIRTGIDADDVREALIGPWRRASTLPSLSWDSSVTRLYALRAGDPSDEKRGSVPAAYWLGVQALALFPVTVVRGNLVTTGVVGGWKDSVFTWPVWSPAISVRTIASLLRWRADRWTSRERASLGITDVFSSRIARSEQGGYGSFSPADVVLPRVGTSR